MNEHNLLKNQFCLEWILLSWFRMIEWLLWNYWIKWDDPIPSWLVMCSLLMMRIETNISIVHFTFWSWLSFLFFSLFDYLQIDLSLSIQLSWSCSLRINAIMVFTLIWVGTGFMVEDTVSIIVVLLSSYLIWRIRMIADQRNVLMYSALSADNDRHLQFPIICLRSLLLDSYSVEDHG